MDEYFENGYHIDRYHALEEDLLRFLDYVTLEFYPKPQNQKYIKSIYLADLMLRIGSNISIFFDKYIETILSGEKGVYNLQLWQSGGFKTIAAELREKKDKSRGWNWGDYKKLDPILNLSNRFVFLIPLNEKIYPFRYEGEEGKPWTEINERETGFWWNSYNNIKHNAAFNGAHLNNVLQASAALFLLFIATDLIYCNKSTQYDYVRTGIENGLLYQKISTRLFSKSFDNPKLANP